MFLFPFWFFSSHKSQDLAHLCLNYFLLKSWLHKACKNSHTELTGLNSGLQAFCSTACRSWARRSTPEHSCWLLTLTHKPCCLQTHRTCMLLRQVYAHSLHTEGVHHTKWHLHKECKVLKWNQVGQIIRDSKVKSMICSSFSCDHTRPALLRVFLQHHPWQLVCWDPVRCTDEAVAIPSILRSGHSGPEVGGSHKTQKSSLSAGFMLSLGGTLTLLSLIRGHKTK